MPPQKYRKLPVVVEAVLFDGSNVDEVVAWVGEDDTRVATLESIPPVNLIFISTLEGEMEASPGDYVIKGVKGEFYPCKPDIFEATYEAASED